MLVIWFSLSGCAGLLPRPISTDTPSATEQQAASLLAMLRLKNATLQTFKGVGTLRLRDANGSWSMRLAMAGRRPDRLRVEILPLPGRTAYSLATDGEWLYLNDRTHDQLYRERTHDASLKRLLKIPIKASAVLELLTGRIPIRDHHSASVEQDQADQMVLTLKGRWQRVLQKIYLTAGADQVQRIEIYDGRGNLAYQAFPGETTEIDGFFLPMQLTLTDGQKQTVRLDILRYQPNATVNPDMFTLETVR